VNHLSPPFVHNQRDKRTTSQDAAFVDDAEQKDEGEVKIHTARAQKSHFPGLAFLGSLCYILATKFTPL
jgi:hypothetical protein